MERDEQNYRKLIAMGFNVIVVWECQLNKKCRDETLAVLTRKLRD